MTTSVIITAFNLEQYIAEAIQSVLDQTKKADEIIVVDDCSTDNTAAVITSFGNSVCYIKMPQNSGGLSATFFGLRQANGDIVLFLDGDDVWMPEKLESVLPLYEAHPKMGIVSHDYQRVNADRRPFNFQDDTQQNIETILATRNTVEQQSDAFKESILAKKGYWGGSAYSLRRRFVDIDKFEAWRSSFPYIRNTYLDLVLPTFVLVHHPDIVVGYVHKKLFDYRIHATNTSGNKLPTVDAAIKALHMGHCTTLATYGLINKQPDFKAYAQKQQLHIVEYEYLNDKTKSTWKIFMLCH
ncbi:MAG: glycosyltransferase family 2 protein [Chitinophagaceae bacterium]|nr:MAG: glycosyltransferase family 2 protein [Chitinophagaceae bacterium]